MTATALTASTTPLATRYHIPHGGGLGNTFAHSVASGAGWHIGTMLASLLSPGVILVLIVVGVVFCAIRRLTGRGVRR
jgi:putative Ca2+/H+ antiporter (TMEM165/GDT1 family)